MLMKLLIKLPLRLALCQYSNPGEINGAQEIADAKVAVVTVNEWLLQGFAATTA